MALLLNVVVFLVFMLLPLLSFLRSSGTFRGAANAESFLSAGGTSAAQVRARRRRRYRDNALRVACYLMLLVPIKYMVARKLDQRQVLRQSRWAAREVREGHRSPLVPPVDTVRNGSVPAAEEGQACLAGVLPQGARLGYRLTAAAADTTAPRSSLLRVWRTLCRVGLVAPRGLLRVARAVDGAATHLLSLVPFLPSRRTYLLVSGMANVLYAAGPFLSHHESDPALRRRNNTRVNRLINRAKFGVGRRLMWWLYHPLKERFALKLIPAYGALPMFVFPTEENLRILRAANEGKRASQLGPGTPRLRRRASRAAANVAGGGDGSVAVGAAAASSSSEDDWDAEEFQQLHMQRLARQSQRQMERDAGTLAGVTHETSHMTADENSGSPLQREDTAAPTPTRTSFVKRTPASTLAADDSPRGRADNVAPAPALECAQYFFAAHPHGILPACSIISLLSNFMGRDEHLFIDNRGFPSATETAEAAAAAASGSGRFAEAWGHQRLSAATAGGDEEPFSVANAFTPFLPSGVAAPPPLSFTVAEQRLGVAERNRLNLSASAFTVTHTQHMSTGSPATSPKNGPLSPSSPVPLRQGNCRSPPAGVLPPSRHDRSPHQATQRAADEDNSTFYPSDTHRRNPAALEALQSRVPPRYAKGRYYVYHRELRRFVLQPDRDESRPPAGFQQNCHPSPPVNFFGSRIRAVVATFPFSVPIMREAYMLAGLLDASYATCRRVLRYNNAVFQKLINRHRFAKDARRKERAEGAESVCARPVAPSSEDCDGGSDDGSNDDEEEEEMGEFVRRTGCPREFNMNHLLVFPGGASEALLSSHRGPTRLLLRRRRGFLRLALQTRSAVVPVFTFGETDYYEQYGTTSSRWAAPLEDDADSLFRSEAAALASESQDELHEASPGAPDGYYAQAIPSSADDEASMFSSTASAATPNAPGLLPRPHRTPDQQMLEAEKEKRRRAFHEQHRPSAHHRPHRRHASDEPGQRHRSTSPSADHRRGEEERGGTHASQRATASNSEGSKPSRLPKWLQRVQVLVQQTFGISLPFVKNLVPKRGVKAMTVVGRPLFFDLPAELRRMYDDPSANYDKELERPVLAAAQDVYFAELQDLFNRYAPAFYADHSRRKLIII